MVAKNDITGDALRTKASNDKYADGWNRIFGKKKETWSHVCKHNGSMEVEKNQSCNWCGEKEDGSLD